MLFVVPITDMMVIYGANGYENIRLCKVRLGGAHGAYVPGVAILPPWDFPPKVLVIFFRFLVKGEHRAEACSGDNAGGVNNHL